MKSFIFAMSIAITSCIASVASAENFDLSNLGEAFQMPAHAMDVADGKTVEFYVETVYPRISSFAPMQTQESINNRVRYFTSPEAFAEFAQQRADDNSLELVYTKGGISIDQIISKISVRDMEDGNWRAEFVSRRLTMSQDGQDSKCYSVGVNLSELPVQAGMNVVAIKTISNKHLDTECPKP